MSGRRRDARTSALGWGGVARQPSEGLCQLRRSRQPSGTLDSYVAVGNRRGLLPDTSQSARVIKEGRGRVKGWLGLRNRRQWSSIDERFASQRELFTHGPHRSGFF